MVSTRLLQAVCLGTWGFGAVLVLAPGATRAGFGWLIFGDIGALDAWPEPARWYATLVHGVLGAVMMGWATALLLALRPAEHSAVPGWRVVAGSVALWFVVDTLHSLAMGAWTNALLNTGFAALFAAGLWVSRPRTAQRSDA